MSRPKVPEIERLAFAITALPPEKRNALDVAIKLYEKLSSPQATAPARERRVPVRKPAPESANV